MKCAHCPREFQPKRPHQRFCSAKCRAASHAQKQTGVVPAAVSRVTILKGGVRSVVLRIDPIAANNAFSLESGRLLGLVDLREEVE